MNPIKTLQCDEIRYASRTLETILLTNKKGQEKVVYLYNYDGVHFRIFENVFEVGKFYIFKCISQTNLLHTILQCKKI